MRICRSPYVCSTIDGEYTLYNINSSLAIGTYYVKLEGQNHYTDPKAFEVVDNLISFDFVNTMELDDDISDLISNVSVSDYSIYYSTEVDGTYSIYTQNTSLSVGTYFIKLVSGEKESESKKLIVTRIYAGDFELSNFTYGEAIMNYVTVPLPIENSDFYISDTIDGEYVQYDIFNNYDVGTYYIILQNDTQYCGPEQLVISPAEIEFSLTSTIDYGRTLYDEIGRVTPDDEDVLASMEIYISDSIDGEYDVYDPTMTLDMGTYYIYLASGINYKSEIREVTVTKIQAQFTYVKTPVFGNNTAGVKVRISCDKFFNSSYATMKGKTNEYNYYVVVTYEIDGVEHSYTFDYLNREFVIDNFGDGGGDASEIEFTYEYFLPDVFEVTNDSNTETFTMSEGIEAESVNISYTDNEVQNEYRISAKLNYYALSGHSITAKYILSDTGYNWTTTSASYNDDTGMYYFNVSATGVTNNTIRAYFVLVEGDYETTVVTFDVSSFADFDSSSDFHMTLDNQAIKTYNDDGTINVYKDLGFVDETAYTLEYEIGYGKYVEDGETNIRFTTLDKYRSSDRFLILEYLDNDYYAISYIHIIKVVDDVEYVVYAYEFDNDFTENSTMVSVVDKSVPVSGYYDDENLNGYYVYANSNYVLPNPKGSMSVYVAYEDDPSGTIDYYFNETNFGYDNAVLLEFNDYSNIVVSYSFTEAMTITEQFANQIFDNATENMKITTSEQFEQIAAYMLSEYDIDIRGSYSAERNNETITFKYDA